MKNKKSKIIVPALGLILLSTAASISGSVAWFTANRTATITAGEFAVVKTGDDLKVTLGAVAGVNTPAENDVAISVKTGYKLTDSSFNHAKFDAPILPIITPDTARGNVATTNGAVALASASESNLLRGAESGKTYSAFVWTMQFQVSFSASATKDQGLFLDLSNDDTYMHEKLHIDEGESVVGYYSNPKCSGDALTGTAGTGGQDVYQATPNGTGKAFRIAFVPTAIGGTGTGTSVGYAKVWADNEVSTDDGSGKYVTSTSGALTSDNYGTATVQYSGNASSASYSSAAAKSGCVLMYNGDNTGIPTDDSITVAEALNDSTKAKSNFLGYFKCQAEKTVTITYTCVAWYEGTNPNINGTTTDFETIVASMKFGVAEMKAAA